MKTLLITFFLSCASVFAADTGVRVATSTTTNAASAMITKTEVFTRDGQTNLVRQTNTKDGVVERRVHWFFRDGARLATYVVERSSYDGYAGPASTLFVPQPGLPYSVSLEFSPSNEVTYAAIGKNDCYILDGFTCTNGIFHPDELSHISEIRNVEQAAGELRKK
jgi:hypothetical protein